MLMRDINSFIHDSNDIPFISISDVHKRTISCSSKKREKRYNSLKNWQVLQETCANLHNSGQILLIPDQQNFEESMLVFNEDEILSKVHGCLKDLKEKLRNASGILDGSQLKEITSALLNVHPKSWGNENIDTSVLKYLVFAQFCTAISPSELINPSNNLEQATHYFSSCFKT